MERDLTPALSTGEGEEKIQELELILI